MPKNRPLTIIVILLLDLTIGAPAATGCSPGRGESQDQFQTRLDAHQSRYIFIKTYSQRSIQDLVQPLSGFTLVELTHDNDLYTAVMERENSPPEEESRT